MHFVWFSMSDGFLTTRFRIPPSSPRDSGGILRLVARLIHLTWKTIQNAYHICAMQKAWPWFRDLLRPIEGTKNPKGQPRTYTRYWFLQVHYNTRKYLTHYMYQNYTWMEDLCSNNRFSILMLQSGIIQYRIYLLHDCTVVLFCEHVLLGFN